MPTMRGQKHRTKPSARPADGGNRHSLALTSYLLQNPEELFKCVSLVQFSEATEKLIDSFAGKIIEEIFFYSDWEANWLHYSRVQKHFSASESEPSRAKHEEGFCRCLFAMICLYSFPKVTSLRKNFNAKESRGDFLGVLGSAESKLSHALQLGGRIFPDPSMISQLSKLREQLEMELFRLQVFAILINSVGRIEAVAATQLRTVAPWLSPSQSIEILEYIIDSLEKAGLPSLVTKKKLSERIRQAEKDLGFSHRKPLDELKTANERAYHSLRRLQSQQDRKLMNKLAALRPRSKKDGVRPREA